MMNDGNPSGCERGFVLATSLVLLLLLTTLSIATYYATVISQQTSATAQESTQAYYYAETGINYLSWALQNDAELDGYDAVGSSHIRMNPGGTVSTAAPFDAYARGDKYEWLENKGNPSNLQSIHGIFSGVPGIDFYGQLGYFDNRDVYARPVALIGSNTFADGYAGLPSFYDIYAQLSGYIILAIDQYGTITPTLSSVPHAPLGDNFSGAIVWLTAGDPYTDRQLSPIDAYAAPLLAGIQADQYGSILPVIPAFPPPGLSLPPFTTIYDLRSRLIPTTLPNYYTNLRCNLGLFNGATSIACDQGSGQWLTRRQYSLVAYAIGYTRGRARKMIRMTLGNF